MLTRKMKDSGIEWIGEVPEEWETRRLKVAIKRVRELIEKYDGENILSLTMNGVIVRDLINPVGKMPTTFDGYQKIKKGNIITCLFDIDVTPRCVGIANHEGLTSPAYTQYKINEEFDTKFVFYYLLMLDNDKVIVPITKSLRNTMKNEDFLNLGFSFPNLKNQIKISEFIDENIKRINNLKKEIIQSITELKKYKQSLITEAVTKGLDPNVEMKDSGIEWIEKIPKQWKPWRIKYVLFEKNDKSITGAEEPLSMSQVHGIIPSRDMENIPNAASSYTGYRIVDKDDLVFNKLKAHLGVFDVSNYYGLVSPDYAVYKAKENYLVHYLNYLFKTSIMISEFIKNSRGVGAGLTRLYTNEFFNIKVPLPNIEEQQRIVSYLDEKSASIDKLIADKTKVIEELESYKKSLIYEYVTGKKEV